MVESHSYRRRAGYGRDSSNHPFLDSRERIAQARRAAEALFAPKPPSAEPLSSRPQPAAEQPPPLPSHGKTAATAPDPEAVAKTPIDPEQPASTAIPASQITRIRTWVRYGMTFREVAEVYGVPIGEVARVLRKG